MIDDELVKRAKETLVSAMKSKKTEDRIHAAHAILREAERSKISDFAMGLGGELMEFMKKKEEQHLRAMEKLNKSGPFIGPHGMGPFAVPDETDPGKPEK